MRSESRDGSFTYLTSMCRRAGSPPGMARDSSKRDGPAPCRIDADVPHRAEQVPRRVGHVEIGIGSGGSPGRRKLRVGVPQDGRSGRAIERSSRTASVPAVRPANVSCQDRGRSSFPSGRSPAEVRRRRAVPARRAVVPRSSGPPRCSGVTVTTNRSDVGLTGSARVESKGRVRQRSRARRKRLRPGMTIPCSLAERASASLQKTHVWYAGCSGTGRGEPSGFASGRLGRVKPRNLVLIRVNGLWPGLRLGLCLGRSRSRSRQGFGQVLVVGALGPACPGLFFRLVGGGMASRSSSSPGSA